MISFYLANKISLLFGHLTRILYFYSPIFLHSFIQLKSLITQNLELIYLFLVLYSAFWWEFISHLLYDGTCYWGIYNINSMEYNHDRGKTACWFWFMYQGRIDHAGPRSSIPPDGIWSMAIHSMAQTKIDPPLCRRIDMIIIMIMKATTVCGSHIISEKVSK